MATRERILSVHHRIASGLVGIQDESEIVDELNHEIELALLALSEDVL